MSGGAGRNGGFGSDSQATRRTSALESRQGETSTRIDALEALTNSGSIASTGLVALTTGAATSTVKTDAKITATCLILPLPTSSGAYSLDNGITGIVAAAGSFTISHTASALTRTFNYIAFKP